MIPFLFLCLALPALARSALVDLSPHYNNKGFGSRPGEASLDTEGRAFPSDVIGTDGRYVSVSTGLEYDFGGYRHGNDNVMCAGQNIEVPENNYMVAGLLMTTDVRSQTAKGNLTLLYEDYSEEVEIRAQSFWWYPSARRGQINYPYFFTANETNHNASFIYETTFSVNPERTLTGVKLPNLTNVEAGRLHLFSLTLREKGLRRTPVEVQMLRPTQELDHGDQLVEVVLNHVGDECIQDLHVSVEAEGVETVRPYTIRRFCPGDQKRVHIVTRGESEEGTVIMRMDGLGWEYHLAPAAPFGIRDFTPSTVIHHDSPRWFDAAKFGIFIHYGPYSVPAWGNSTPHENYAEWYWFHSSRSGIHAAEDASGFRQHRLDTYGPDLNYDDFLANYTAARFDAKEWVDLFADAGAQYFVFTTKHHDGWVNFDTPTTNRTTMHYGPRRDLLRELFDAAKEHQPHLKRGTYYSLPEWFNPEMEEYGFASSDGPLATTFAGMLARNPFTGKEEPYTGSIPLNDYVQDLMMPQMDALVYEYESDIMWCDEGAFNDSDDFAARWWNWVRTQGREVTMNDRCGSPWVSDYDTPEYATFSQSQTRKWESNSGMDPFSYGFNRMTKPWDYMNASTLVHDLVDIISKNGNLLLDVGPMADGRIPQVEMDHLRDAGKWIHAHREAIFNTTNWFITPQEGSLRFTQTNEAFYILSLEKPEGRVKVEAPVPIMHGDRVSMITMHGEKEVKWGLDNGFWIDVGDLVQMDKWCWVFKVEYRRQVLFRQQHGQQ